MSIQLVVFDIAGTTVRDAGNINEVFRNAFLKAGISSVSKMEVDEVMGYRKKDAIRSIVRKHRPQWGEGQDQINLIHDDFSSQMVSFYENTGEIEPLPFAERTFLEFQNNKVKVALNTGFSRAITEPILRRLGWDHAPFIDQVICSDEVEQGRPYAFMIQKLMKDLKIDHPEDVAKIGDTKVDIEEGQNSGCGIVVAVTTGAQTKTELAKSRPDYIINSLEFLPSLIL